MNNYNIRESLRNFSISSGKTMRVNRFYYSRKRLRIGDISYYNYRGERCSPEPRKVPDGLAYGIHYSLGEYPTNGWPDVWRPRTKGNTRKSSRIRRKREKRQLYLEILAEGYI